MRQFSNNGATLLASALSDSSPNVQVTTSTGDVFPVAGGDDFFMITIEDSSGQFEIARCITRSGGSDTLQCLRGEEGTTPLTFSPGARVELRTTKETMESFFQRDGDTIDGGTF